MAVKRKAKRSARPGGVPFPRKRSEWLLMVYMAAAAPNLQEPLGLDLDELSRPLRDMDVDVKTVDVVVQVDTPTGISKRFRLDKNGVHALKVFPTDVKTTLKYFVTQTVGPRPRYRKKGLVIWGHANGVGRGLEARVPLLGGPTLVDREEPRSEELRKRQHSLLVPLPPAASAGSVWGQLGELPNSCILDLVGFDACYMASVEVICELRGSHSAAPRVKYVLAPQAAIALEGWHYDLLLDQIVATRGLVDAETLGKAVVDQVGLSQSSPEALTLIDMSGVKSLTDRIALLVATMKDFYYAHYREPGFRRLLEDAVQDATWARVRQFLDLSDICALIASRIPNRTLRNAARSVLELLSKSQTPLIVDTVCALDVPLGGLSIYSPWPRATSRLTAAGVRNVQVDRCEYADLQFSTLTGWHELMYYPDALVNAERRWVRLETRHRVDDLANSLADNRAGDPKAPGRAGDPKAPGRAGDPKAPGRGEGKPFGRGDDVRFAEPEGRFDT